LELGLLYQRNIHAKIKDVLFMMRAMVLETVGKPLKLVDLPIPTPDKGQLLIQVHACGVCRTDLHIIDGELPHPALPLILGHQIVGTVIQSGQDVTDFQVGKRVGIPWLGGSCGHCHYCLAEQENLCKNAAYTGYQLNGGFAEYCVANSQFSFPIPDGYSDWQAAPLLCAGLIGYRAYRMANKAKRLGFYGFGAAAHILTQLAIYQGCEVFAFTRKGDQQTQEFARTLGAVWAGGSEDSPPLALDAAIIFAPVGPLVPLALKAVDKGGSVICAGIYMSDIPSFPYRLLYEERLLRSVTNLTRKDGIEFLTLAPQVPIQTAVTLYPLEKANEALQDLREGRFNGSAVIQIDH
jgi:propanol-preferring alcohol dehydrogenase